MVDLGLEIASGAPKSVIDLHQGRPIPLTLYTALCAETPTGYTKKGVPYYSKKASRALSVGQTALIVEDGYDQRAAKPYENCINKRQIAWLLHRQAHGNVSGADFELIQAVEDEDE